MLYRGAGRDVWFTSAVSQAAAPPDFSGVWVPDIKDQKRQEVENTPPWKPDILQQIQHMVAEEKAGRPFLVLSHCMPHGMPSWMLITHNAMEILVTPGRITMLGEGDGNRMRRIYTDGRAHPEDPDLTFHGHSIGHWEGDTLVIDTVGDRAAGLYRDQRGRPASRIMATCTSSNGYIWRSRMFLTTTLK